MISQKNIGHPRGQKSVKRWFWWVVSQFFEEVGGPKALNDGNFQISELFEKILKNDQFLEKFSRISKFQNVFAPSIFVLGEN